MLWLVSSHSSCAESLTSSVTVFGDRAFEEVWKSALKSLGKNIWLKQLKGGRIYLVYRTGFSPVW